MDTNTKRQIKALEKLRLPELQARFAEVTGEATRSPNRTYLIRQITEALVAQAAAPRPGETVATAAASVAAAPVAPARPARPGRRPRRGAASDAPAASSAERPASDANAAEPRLSKLSIEELQARYAEAVGRHTGSQHRGYVERAAM